MYESRVKNLSHGTSVRSKNGRGFPGGDRQRAVLRGFPAPRLRGLRGTRRSTLRKKDRPSPGGEHAIKIIGIVSLFDCSLSTPTRRYRRRGAREQKYKHHRADRAAKSSIPYATVVVDVVSPDVGTADRSAEKCSIEKRECPDKVASQGWYCCSRRYSARFSSA